MTQELTIYRRSELEGADCLYRYDQIWRKGVDDSSDYALRGQAFAAIKHTYIERLVANGLTQDEEESRAAFTQGIAESRCPDRLIAEVRDLWDRHAERFELRLDRFVAAEEKRLPIICTACRKDWYVAEVVAAGKVCPSCGSTALELRPFGFTPDLVLAHPEGNILEIVDDKTFYVALTEAQAKASFQGRFYTRFGMDRWPGFTTYRFTFNFVRLGKQVSVDYTQTDLDRLDREVAAAVAKIEHAVQEDYWPATAGPSCSYCELDCPIRKQPAIVPKGALTPSQRQILGQWCVAAEQMLKVAKKALKADCALNGANDVGGVVWDNRPVIQRTYPIGSVLSILQSRNIAGAMEEEGLTISQSALAKLLKRFPVLEEDLLPYQQTKTSYRFSARKPGVGDEDDE